MLRYTSFIGVLCTIMISIVVVCEFLFNETLVPQPPLSQLSEAKLADFGVMGIVSSFPLVIYLYMYQIIIPQTYSELSNKNPNEIYKIMGASTGIAIFFYLLVGFAGYLTFVSDYNAGIG